MKVERNLPVVRERKLAILKGDPELCDQQKKAGKLLAELDTSKGIGLIERRKQGQGKPTMIYVKQFVDSTHSEPGESHAQLGSPKTELQEVP